MAKVEYEALLDEIDRTKGEFLRDLNKAVGSTFEFVSDISRTKNLPLLQMDDQAISMIPECAKEWVEMLSNHEQSSVATSLNLQDVDMTDDKDARDDPVETTKTTEIIMSDAICTEACPMSAPHFFDDAAYGILPSLYMVSGDES